MTLVVVVRCRLAQVRLAAQEGRYKSSRLVHFEDPEASTYLLMSMVWSAILQAVLYRPPHLSRERLIHTLVEMVLKLL